jgi:hypothetical protein
MELYGLIVRILISLDILLILIGICIGIVFAIISFSETDPVVKARNKKIMKWSFLGPIISLILILVIWGLGQVIITM